MDYLIDPVGVMIKDEVKAKTAELQAENDYLKDRIQELEIEVDDLKDYKWMYEELCD